MYAIRIVIRSLIFFPFGWGMRWTHRASGDGGRRRAREVRGAGVEGGVPGWLGRPQSEVVLGRHGHDRRVWAGGAARGGFGRRRGASSKPASRVGVGSSPHCPLCLRFFIFGFVLLCFILDFFRFGYDTKLARATDYGWKSSRERTKIECDDQKFADFLSS